MSSSSLHPLYLCVLLIWPAVAEYESAGCSDEGCGVPCYLKPPSDSCHYTEHNPCGDEGVTDLDLQLAFLNGSLVRLQEKLIQKNIIPAGTSCPSLKSIENGGIIYSDLILSIGVTANYVCFSGFSLHGHGTYECSTKNQWIRTNDQSLWEASEVPSCEYAVVVCEALVLIPSGHISYHTVDTAVVQPGDVAYYSCDTLYKLEGDSIRICLRNGSWSGEEPTCISPHEINSTESSQNRGNTNEKGVIAGGIVEASIIVIIVVVLGIILISYCVHKKRSKNRKGYEAMEEVDINSVTGRGPGQVDHDNAHQSLIHTVKPDDKL